MFARVPERSTFRSESHVRRIIQIYRSKEWMARVFRRRRIVIPTQSVIDGQSRGDLPCILTKERQIVEDWPQLRSVGSINSGIHGNLGLDQSFHIIEVITDI